MAPRQDIDALLISALYGELTPAEESRLAAHLEAHPADRTALADLTHAREVVRSSRLLEVQLEPPASVSALLIQEAARRAPRQAAAEAGWLARFLRSFMMHPAMAAAAMLVVVVGVATLVTKRSGDHFAETSSPAQSATASDPMIAAPASSPSMQGRLGEGATPASAAAATAEHFRVSLDDGVGGSTDSVGSPTDRVGGYAADDGEKQEAATGRGLGTPAYELAKQAPTKGAKKDSGNGIELRKPAPAPKELDARPRPTSAPRRDELGGFATAPDADRTIVAGGGPGGGDGASIGASRVRPEPTTRSTPTTSAPPPPPQAPAQTIGARDKSANEKTVARAPADDQAGADPLIAWAREQHAVLIAQVRAGNCTSAGRLAVSISNRAPSYYEQNVATDRAVKDCQPYIAAARQKDEQQRAQRVRASDAKRANEPTKRAADQPSKPTATEAK